MNELSAVLSEALNSAKNQSGSDYTAKVTKVEGETAYVQITGSEITDTPVSMSTSCKPGDVVRVRVANGKAWITGNDTAPPENNTELNERVRKKMDSDMGNKDPVITFREGLIRFLADTIVIESDNFKLDENGNAVFSGRLEAAGGTFEGAVEFNWPNPSVAEKVYIGDLSKGAPLLVYGRSESYGNIETTLQAGFIEVAQDYEDRMAQMTPYGVQTFSDRRLKEKIKDLSPDIAKKLKPVQFCFKGSDRIQYGFIAQDVQELIPEAVHEGRNGYLMLNHSEIIAPLCALVLEQEERINQLEKRLEALEDKL